jgi:nicotinamide-nucleotide amidase
MNTINVFKLFGVNEKALSSFLEESGVLFTIDKFANDYLLKLDFSSLDDIKVDEITKDFLAKFGKFVYAESDISLKEQLVKILTVRGEKISTAESFTGGGVAHEITSVSGASKVFYEGVVAYSPDSKHLRLGVSYQTLDTFKPVSSQVACEMVKGLLEVSDTDFAISTTGIAGPNSDSSDFEVGLCYIGIGSKSKITVFKHKFKGNRQEIIKNGIDIALFHAIIALRSGNYDV